MPQLLKLRCPGAHTPQETPPPREALTPRPGSGPHSLQPGKSPHSSENPAQPKNKLKNVKSHYSQAVTPPLLQNSFCQVMTPFISLLGKFLKRISIFTVSNFFPPIPLKIYSDLHHFCCKTHWSILILLDPSAPHHTVELSFTHLAFGILHVFRFSPPSLVSP